MTHDTKRDPPPLYRPPLTPRQAQVARLVGRGLSYKQIGAQLDIAARTVESYVHVIAARLPPDNRTPYRRVQQWALENLNAA